MGMGWVINVWPPGYRVDPGGLNEGIQQNDHPVYAWFRRCRRVHLELT